MVKVQDIKTLNMNFTLPSEICEIIRYLVPPKNLIFSGNRSMNKISGDVTNFRVVFIKDFIFDTINFIKIKKRVFPSKREGPGIELFNSCTGLMSQMFTAIN